MMFKSKILTATLALMALGSTVSFAGNEDRAGSAGAGELLVNPWARSAGWAGAGMSWVKGIEAQFSNVAGLAYLGKTEIMFTNTNWLGSAGIGMNALGFGQRIGETSVIGIGVVANSYGDIPITTTEIPEGGIGTFKPQAMNFNLSFAKEFTNAISGGMNLKILSHSISNLKAQGIALDAGIRYSTGDKEKIKFGIALKNVGPPMRYSGDGLSIETQYVFSGQQSATNQKVSSFELPSLVNIGASYDFRFGSSNAADSTGAEAAEDAGDSDMHVLTLAGTFTSNSFTRDQWRAGLQYAMRTPKANFYLRAGLVYEKGLFDASLSATALTGPTAGLSVEIPTGNNGGSIGVDYSFRSSNPFGAIHSIGIRIDVR
jgi:hypothetical protein